MNEHLHERGATHQGLDALVGKWAVEEDGVNWKYHFELTYTRVAE